MLLGLFLAIQSTSDIQDKGIERQYLQLSLTPHALGGFDAKCDPVDGIGS